MSKEPDPLDFKTPEEEKALQIYYAKVLLREARARQERSPGFSATLLGWAMKARRRAQELSLSAKANPGFRLGVSQGDLFR